MFSDFICKYLCFIMVSYFSFSSDHGQSELGTLNEALQELLDGIQVSFQFRTFMNQGKLIVYGKNITHNFSLKP